ncbi:MAG TPA: hypothetical protein VJ909_01650 [Prolixibacteraceae bacterium]|nr:hypothetical protein [Prolixibacteraceae bacterium]
MQLKYGMNPNQDYAEVIAPEKSFEVLNGRPSVINVLDALNSWQLVKEAKECLGKKVSTSFKHVTPSGVGAGSNLSEKEKQAYLVKIEPTELASAYIKARGVDRLASFGDFIALSDEVDVETAKIIKSEVSDGVIAPSYNPEALDMLKQKKKGGYVIFQIDPNYIPPETESRELFGITIKQKRNDLKITKDLLNNVVTKTNNLSETIIDDLLLGMITLKYTQSNSICTVYNGQVIGIGSGQQSRILCSGLALNKANVWQQKQQLDYSFLNEFTGMKRTETDQVIEQQREKEFGDKVMLNKLDGVCLISDGFFPQKDNIELAHKYGIKFIASPMGSIRDQEIIDTADKYGITFINTGVRLFHH